MSRIRLEDCSPALKKRIQDAIRKETASHNSTVPVANHEPDTSHEPAVQDEAKVFDKAVSIHYHSVRKRLTDADAIFSKWITDSLVTNGVLYEDNPTYVKSITYSQTKGEPEQTIITITEV